MLTLSLIEHRGAEGEIILHHQRIFHLKKLPLGSNWQGRLLRTQLQPALGVVVLPQSGVVLSALKSVNCFPFDSPDREAIGL